MIFYSVQDSNVSELFLEIHTLLCIFTGILYMSIQKEAPLNLRELNPRELYIGNLSDLHGILFFNRFNNKMVCVCTRVYVHVRA